MVTHQPLPARKKPGIKWLILLRTVVQLAADRSGFISWLDETCLIIETPAVVITRLIRDHK